MSFWVIIIKTVKIRLHRYWCQKTILSTLKYKINFSHLNNFKDLYSHIRYGYLLELFMDYPFIKKDNNRAILRSDQVVYYVLFKVDLCGLKFVVALLLPSRSIARLLLWLFSLDWYLVINCDISSFTVQVLRSLFIYEFDTYQEAWLFSWVCLLDWNRWLIYKFVVLAYPQSWRP